MQKFLPEGTFNADNFSESNSGFQEIVIHDDGQNGDFAGIKAIYRTNYQFPVIYEVKFYIRLMILILLPERAEYVFHKIL